MKKLSLCMIVKNEEEVLSRCLECVKDIVDEIIIVDTGSIDSTRKIANQYTDKVFDFEWVNDFSKARNFSISKASCDYIIWLDADDVIDSDNKARIKKLKNELESEDIDVVMAKYSVAFDENDNSMFTYYRERIFKKESNLVFKGFVHEAVAPIGKVIYSDIEIKHKKIKETEHGRNLKIYEYWKNKGADFSVRDKFYYARELYFNNKREKAIKSFKHFLKEENAFLENIIEAKRFLARCYRGKGDLKSAKEELISTFLIDIPRAEIMCDLGSIFKKENKYDVAVHWYESATKMVPNLKNGGFCEIDYYGFIPYIELSVCYYNLGKFDKAYHYNEIAGSLKPTNTSYLYNKNFFNSFEMRNQENM